MKKESLSHSHLSALQSDTSAVFSTSTQPEFSHPTPRAPHLDLVVVADGDEHLLVEGVEGHAVDDVAVGVTMEMDAVVAVPQVATLVFRSAGDNSTVCDNTNPPK